MQGPHAHPAHPAQPPHGPPLRTPNPLQRQLPPATGGPVRHRTAPSPAHRPAPPRQRPAPACVCRPLAWAPPVNASPLSQGGSGQRALGTRPAEPAGHQGQHGCSVPRPPPHRQVRARTYAHARAHTSPRACTRKHTRAHPCGHKHTPQRTVLNIQEAPFLNEHRQRPERQQGGHAPSPRNRPPPTPAPSSQAPPSGPTRSIPSFSHSRQSRTKPEEVQRASWGQRRCLTERARPASSRHPALPEGSPRLCSPRGAGCGGSRTAAPCARAAPCPLQSLKIK